MRLFKYISLMAVACLAIACLSACGGDEPQNPNEEQKIDIDNPHTKTPASTDDAALFQNPD